MDSTRRFFSTRPTRRKHNPVAALILFILFLGVSVLLVGCVTKGKIENVMLALTVVKKSISQHLPQGLRDESLNGRELHSGYFNPKNWEDDATEKAERAFATVTILGASRPYNIDVKVVREKRNKNGGYTAQGEDRKLTKELVDRLREVLADRREDRNIIDDFRAF